MLAMNPSPIPCAQGPYYGRQRSAGPLQAPRRPNSKQLAHQDAKVVTRHLHQVTLGDVHQTAQPTPPPTARLTDVRERPLHVLTPLLLQPLAPRPVHPPAVAPVRRLPTGRLVRPDPFLRPLRLRDVGPQPLVGTVGQRLRLVIALVGRYLLDVRGAAGAGQVDL